MSAGYRSPSGVWVGGISSPPVIIPAGYTSPLAFWLGGASASAYTPPTPTGQVTHVRKRITKKPVLIQLLREDEEIIIL